MGYNKCITGSKIRSGTAGGIQFEKKTQDFWRSGGDGSADSPVAAEGGRSLQPGYYHCGVRRHEDSKQSAGSGGLAADPGEPLELYTGFLGGYIDTAADTVLSGAIRRINRTSPESAESHGITGM